MKKIFVVIVLVIIVSVTIFNLSPQIKEKPILKDTGVFLENNIYENKESGFRIKYPEGATFEHAHPELGVPVRFFIPGGKTIERDTENIGIFVKKFEGSIDDKVTNKKSDFSKNGTFDMKEITFGGQKGYRIIYTSNYTAPKKTREMSYFTVKNGVYYEVNYFPVIDENIPNIDKIAESFEFIK